MQMAPIRHMSDGQKSRLVFAYLAQCKPHILFLDEPTNHLDMESIDSLAGARPVLPTASLALPLGSPGASRAPWAMPLRER